MTAAMGPKVTAVSRPLSWGKLARADLYLSFGFRWAGKFRKWQVAEFGVAKLRRARGPLTLTDQLILGLFEGVMTLLGFIVVIFPLAVWSVPQQGPSANTIFYIVLSVGCMSFFGLIGLAYLKRMLFRDRLPQEAPADGPTGYQAYLTWAESQETVRRVERQMRSVKRSALHDFGFMVRVAALLATVFVLVNLAAWAVTDSYYGDTLFLSAEQRWKMLHPDPWDWK